MKLEKITIEGRSNDYLAYLNNDKRRWGRGTTINAAIGDVLRTHAQELGIEVEYPSQ